MTWAIFIYRADGCYHVKNAVGKMVFKQRGLADRIAENMNLDPEFRETAPDGVRVISSEQFETEGCGIDAKGKAYLN